MSGTDSVQDTCQDVACRKGIDACQNECGIAFQKQLCGTAAEVAGIDEGDIIVPRKKGHNGQCKAVLDEKQGGTIGLILLFCTLNRDKTGISAEEHPVVISRADGGAVIEARHAFAAVTYGDGVVTVIGRAIEDDGVPDGYAGTRCGMGRSEKGRCDGFSLKIRSGKGRKAEGIRERGIGEICAVGCPVVIGAVHDGDALCSGGAERDREVDRIGDGGAEHFMGLLGTDRGIERREIRI